jgi:colanic acid biosynthesis glycosyl transferase WcaI
MKILLMAQHYAPEEVSGAVLATDLAEDLAALGHEVWFITCAPNYPEGKVYQGYLNKLIQKEKCGDVRVIRVWSFVTKSKKSWQRILNQGTFSFMSIWGGIVAGKPDVIFSYSPPLPLGITAWKLSKIWNVPWVLRVEDLFPDAAVTTGVLRNEKIISIVYSLEKFLYRHCSHISVISEGFKKIILEKGIPEAKVTVQPVWADPDFIQPSTKLNLFRERLGLNNSFIFLYAGNIGITSSLEDILKTAEKLLDNKDIRFVLIGEGTKKDEIAEIIQRRSLKNVNLLPFQDREDLPEVMAAADVGVVTLNETAATYSLPSKVFNIMASARPILSIAPHRSELARLVTTKKIGVNIAPNDPASLLIAINRFYENPEICDVLGTNGRKTLIEEFSRKECTRKYEEMIKEACKI